MEDDLHAGIDGSEGCGSCGGEGRSVEGVACCCRGAPLCLGMIRICKCVDLELISNLWLYKVNTDSRTVYIFMRYVCFTLHCRQCHHGKRVIGDDNSH